ncbi:hypothetical protein M3Y97_00984800 [Aphelenchoides bicaudatus]|nr:hypothetical protein M3Y97_00984800 [Aphelenchoides bicaudatus]
MGMQYLNLPEQIICFSHVSWIIIEGAPPIVLLTMNETVRKIVFNRIHGKVSVSTTHPNSPVNGHTTPQTITVTPYKSQTKQ